MGLSPGATPRSGVISVFTTARCLISTVHDKEWHVLEAETHSAREVNTEREIINKERQRLL